jgi:hypothetical protein
MKRLPLIVSGGQLTEIMGRERPVTFRPLGNALAYFL